MSAQPDLVAVHPLVLLSVVDHYKRVVAKNKNRRVVGVLLGKKSFLNLKREGEWNKGTIDVTNSYAVPFEEDPKEHRVWFLDHIYHEQMFAMFKKVSPPFTSSTLRLLLKKKLSDGMSPEPNSNLMISKFMNSSKSTALIPFLL
jgi:hypothetical protein